jgi:DNA polymerase
MQKELLFEEISNNIKGCESCPLSKARTKAVPGEGSLHADIMFIGEGPGREEDLSGRPFVGAAGKILDRLLASIGLERGDVFIGNIIKCRPPNNRVPNSKEVEACLQFLYGQIAIIQPTVIVTLGNIPLNTLVSDKLAIGAVHGQELSKDGFDFLPMYHPAAVLYHNELLSVLEKDFLKLSEVVSNLKIKDSRKKAITDKYLGG